MRFIAPFVPASTAEVNTAATTNDPNQTNCLTPHPGPTAVELDRWIPPYGVRNRDSVRSTSQSGDFADSSPHSKTLARVRVRLELPRGFGVRRQGKGVIAAFAWTWIASQISLIQWQCTLALSPLRGEGNVTALVALRLSSAHSLSRVCQRQWPNRGDVSGIAGIAGPNSLSPQRGEGRGEG